MDAVQRKMFVASCFVVAAMSAQLFAFWKPQWLTFPFVDYSMFSDSFPGPEVSFVQPEVHIVDEHGDTHLLDRVLLDRGWMRARGDFDGRFAAPMIKGDLQAALALRPILRRQLGLVAQQAYARLTKYELTEDGVRTEVLLERHYDFRPLGSKGS